MGCLGSHMEERSVEEIQANISNIREEEPISCTSLIMRTFSSAVQYLQMDKCTNQCLTLSETEHKTKLNPGAHFFPAVFPNSYFMREMQLVSAVNENRLELMSVSCLINSLPQTRGKRRPQFQCGPFMGKTPSSAEWQWGFADKQNTISFCTRVSAMFRDQAGEVYE